METGTPVTEADIRARLAAEIARARGVRALAREWGVSPAVVCMTAGGRRSPGPAILRRLGIRATRRVVRHVTYATA